MAYLIVLIIFTPICLTCSRAIKVHRRGFYAGCWVLTGLYAYGCFFALPAIIWQPLYQLMQQCMFAMALFTLVMFVGAVPEDSRFARYVRPIRTELSVMACILTIGHMAVYIPVFARLLGAAYVIATVQTGLIVAIALLVLWAVLGATSLERPKRWLGARRWKNVQRFAYAFYALTYVHLILVLMPSLQQGVLGATASAIAYTLVFGAYAVLRVVQFLRDHAGFPFAMGHSKTLAVNPKNSRHSIDQGGEAVLEGDLS